MADITKICASCKGDGKINISAGSGNGTRPCVHCGERGTIKVRELDIGDLEDKVNDILNKCNDIFEALTAKAAKPKPKAKKAK